MKYLGCAYYPEYWGEERFAEDARLMQAAGINLARIGEFAWSRMEPEEGVFDLDWLHHCIETLASHDIGVLMCTPTATPPAWLTSAYPDTCLVRANGVRATHGRRRHYCTTSDTYRRASAAVTDVLSRELARHPNLLAWQLDNEFGPEMSWCHCANCQSRFQAWLKARYGSVGELNAHWKTGFWSMDYSDWRQVRLSADGEDTYASVKLDSRRFWSEMTIDFAHQQTAIIRRNHPAAMVTTNGMGPLFSPIDYFELFRDLDVACDDLYFDIATMDANVAALNVYRNYKPGRPYWITETGSGALDHNKPPHPDQFRAWAWSSLAHGAEAHVVFRWRTCLSGQEQELQGILEHSGTPRHRYDAVQKCFLELKQHWPRLQDLPLPNPHVAIVHDYQSMWAYETSRVGADIDYAGLIYRQHKALFDRNVAVDIIEPSQALDGYRLVILPSLVNIQPAFAERLTAYVAAGGTILALGQIGLRDSNNNYHAFPGPDHLQDLLGVRIEGGMYLTSHVAPDEALWVPKPNSRAVDLRIEGQLGGAGLAGSASGWAADLTLNGAAALVSFSEDVYTGQPAITEKSSGSGCALYCAAVRLDPKTNDALLDHALGIADIATPTCTPEYVEVVQRGNVTFVINHTPERVRVDLNGLTGTVLLGALDDDGVLLDAFGVCVVATD